LKVLNKVASHSACPKVPNQSKETSLSLNLNFSVTSPVAQREGLSEWKYGHVSR
jgi:hypothetical protein